MIAIIFSFICGMFFGAFALRKIQAMDEKIINEKMQIAEMELRRRKSRTMKDIRKDEEEGE